MNLPEWAKWALLPFTLLVVAAMTIYALFEYLLGAEK